MIEGGRFIRNHEDPDLIKVSQDLIERGRQLNILFESLQSRAERGKLDRVKAIEKLLEKIAAGETFPSL